MGVTRAKLRRFGTERLRVRFEGEFGLCHSFGHVSRELALSLISRPEIDLKLVSLGADEIGLGHDPRGKLLLPFIDRSPSDEVDFHLRHQWPPNLEPPRSGRWILLQPWEFGSLPEKWVNAFRDRVDDVWCFSRYVRDAYRRAGFPRSVTPVIPHGIDPDVFHPDGGAFPIPTTRAFKFLFIGGTLHRKGADLLLEAYLRSFSPHDDVVLVVKDMGTETFYRGQTIGNEFASASKDPTRPEIVYIDRHLTEKELVGLYRSCDALVAPYRGEGFCLPVLEAMACGCHVIATAGGATDDFLDGACGSRIVSDRKETTDRLSDGTKCVDKMFFMVADLEDLARTMRWAYENPTIGRRLGQIASKRARDQWTWERSGEMAASRLRTLAERPIKRVVAEIVEKRRAAAATTALPMTVEYDSQRAKEIELALMRGDLKAIAEPIRRIVEGRVHSGWMPVLTLAEKCLRTQESFLKNDLPETEKEALLAMIREAREFVENQPVGADERPRVSLTMIVRNEEKNIAECLKSVCDLVDEIVVVDTGSRDRTRTIASSLGAKVFDFPWVDHFARARNEAIGHASCDWIFWLDADDRLTEENGDKLRRVFAQLPTNRIVGYSMKVECVASGGNSPTVVDHVRLFPRHSALLWEYRVHENILPAINRMGGEVEWTDVVIHHHGYTDPAIRAKKRQRDHRLLIKNLKECPEDPFVQFNVGHSYLEEGDFKRAAGHLKESIARSEPHYSQVKKAVLV